MRKIHIFIFASCLLAAFSCTDYDALKFLDGVESHIHSEPKRALEELETCDSTDIRGRKARARYSLLYTMALDKNNRMPSDARTITPALEYYQRHGTTDDYIKALYYLGCSQYEAKTYSEAIVTFTKTYELLDKSDDLRYCGLVNQAIADTYMATYNDSEVMPYLEAACDCFSRYGDLSLSDLTLYKMAMQYSILDMHSKADSIYSLILCRDNIPERDLPEVLSNYALSLIKTSPDDMQKAEDTFSKAIELGGSLNSINSWAAYAYVLAVNGKNEKSESIFRQLDSIGSDIAYTYVWRCRAYAENEDYKSAFHALRKTVNAQDSIIDLKLKESSSKAQRDYFALQSAQQKTELHNRTLLIALVVLSFVILLIILLYTFARKRAAFERERAEVLSAFEMLRAQKDSESRQAYLEKLNFEKELSSRDEALAQLKSEYMHMYREQFRELGELCETFLNSGNNRNSQKFIYEKVKEMVSGLNGDAEGQKHFECLINSRMNDVMKHFREDFPSMKEDEYRFVCYVIAGFDATTISVILNMPSLPAVYMKKSRIKKMIASSPSQYKDVYLDLFA